MPRLLEIDHDPFHGVKEDRRFTPVNHDPFANAPKVAPQIYLVRHGATAHNRGGPGKDLIRGWADIPLSPQGEKNALELADKMASAPLALIFCSDLKRAEKTARAIGAKHKNVPVIPTTELRTWNLGPQFEGMPTSPHMISIIKYFVRRGDEAPPGGESFAAFVNRVEGFAKPLFDAMERQKDTAIALVGHGRTVQVLSLWISSACDAACMSKRYATALSCEPDAISPGGYLGFAHVHGHWALTDRFEHGRQAGIPVPDRTALAS